MLCVPRDWNPGMCTCGWGAQGWGTRDACLEMGTYGLVLGWVSGDWNLGTGCPWMGCWVWDGRVWGRQRLEFGDECLEMGYQGWIPGELCSGTRRRGVGTWGYVQRDEAPGGGTLGLGCPGMAAQGAVPRRGAARRDAPVPAGRLPPVVAQSFAGAQQRLGGARRGGGAVQRVGEETPQRGGGGGGGGRGGGGAGGGRRRRRRRSGGGSGAEAARAARSARGQLPPRPRPEVEVEVGSQQRPEQQQHGRPVPAGPRHGPRCRVATAPGADSPHLPPSRRRRRRLPGQNARGSSSGGAGSAGTSGRGAGRALGAGLGQRGETGAWRGRGARGLGEDGGPVGKGEPGMKEGPGALPPPVPVPPKVTLSPCNC